MLRVLAMMLVLGAALSVRAEVTDEQDQCAAAYVASQRARQAGKLREARTQALFCAREACSRVLRGDCMTWSEALSVQIPSVVIDPRYDDGQAPLHPSVTLDGAALETESLARAVPLDPGEHRVRVVADGVETEVAFRALEGVQGQRLQVRLTRPKRAPAALPPEQRSVTLTLAAVTAAGLGSFIAMASAGRLRERDLKDECAPACPRSRGEGISRLYLAADVALGVGVVSGIAGLWLWLRERRAEPATSLDLRVSSERAHISFARRF